MENDPGKRHLVWGTLEQRLRGRQQCVLIKSDTNTDTNSNSNGDSNPNCDSNANPNCESNTNANCYTFAKRYADTDRDAHARPNRTTGSRRQQLK